MAVIVVVLILLFSIWLIFSDKISGNKGFSTIGADKPIIKVLCKDGFLKGYYVSDGLLKGKKYVSNKITAEGTFFNGMQIGQGKEYYENGQLKYIGHFSNDYVAGQGKLFDEIGKLKYEGNFENGYASGYGKLYDDNGYLKCEGNFARLSTIMECEKDPSVPSGKCKEYYENGKLKYIGNFYNGLRHGEGKCYDRNGHLLHKGRFEYGSPVKK